MHPGARLAPTTMTTWEQKALLQASRKSLRDHTLISLALGTGLRLNELLGLDIADLASDAVTVRTRVRLPPAITKGHRGGEMFLSRRLVGKLEKYLRWRMRHEDDLTGEVPLFSSQHGNRLSKRRAQQILRGWQEKASFDRLHGFHSLRHTAITNLYRTTRDILLTQRFARHAHLATTTTYTHATDEDLLASIQKLPC
jgi:site-specific recombinase XerC